MAISTVRAKVNGTWYNLTFDSASGSYKATVTAPGATSYKLAGGYYNVELEATNTAGTTFTTNGSTLAELRLVVKETVAPVITITSPSSGAYVTNNKPSIVCTVVDESNGSGINLSTLVIKIDGTTIPHTTTAVTNGYTATATPTTALSDGSHTITVDVKDNDGNAAVQKTSTFKLDTIPPTLNVTTPSAGLITNTAALTVLGTTNDTTSSPVTITITLNGTAQGTVTVNSNGSFSKAVTLKEGDNTIVVTAKDAAGKNSTVTRTVTLDTSVPKVVSATITPNPANTGTSVVISVVVT